MNEAGKSTILEGIMASIFKYTRTQIEPFFCWNNKDFCRVSLTYLADDGEIYKITSDYMNNRRKLEKKVDGSAVEISAVEKNISPYLKNHFGFDDKKVFENTAFIKQSQMAILEDVPTKSKIKDMIEEVLAGRSDVTGTKALKKIKKFLKDGKKELEKLDTKHREIVDKLDQANEIQSRVSMQSNDHEKISDDLKQKKSKLEKLEENKKLFDAKEDLLGKKTNLVEQINTIDNFINTLGEKKQEKVTVVENKIIPISLVMFGFVIMVASFALSYPIVSVFVVPLIIYGLYKLVKKTEPGHVPAQGKSKQAVTYESQKKGLINQLAVVESRLEEYKLVNYTYDDFRDLESLKKEVDELKERNIELRTSVTTTTSLVESPEDVQERLNSLDEGIENLQNKIEEHDLAAYFLERAETGVYQKFTPLIESDSKVLLRAVTDNRYENLKIDEESLDIFVIAPEINDYVDASILSQGTRDQVYFTIRTVLVDLLAGNLNLPLILDDPFHNFDEIRLNKTIELINKISGEKQIIMMSHRPYHTEFENFGGNVIELK